MTARNQGREVGVGRERGGGSMKQNVTRLQIPMKDSAFVRMLHGVGQRGDQPARRPVWQPAPSAFSQSESDGPSQ